MTIETFVHDASYMSTSKGISFDEAALEKLFKEYFNPLCAFCQYKFGFELDTAKEAVHTGFIKLWENRESVSADSSVKAYLYKIITNISLDILRHNNVRLLHAKNVLKSGAANAALNLPPHSDLKQLECDVQLAVNELPDQMRKIFELSRYEGLKYAEIASVLNLSVKTVETQMCRALAKLREKLSHYLTVLFLCVFFQGLKNFF